jgi:hypothetical protein
MKRLRPDNGRDESRVGGTIIPLEDSPVGKVCEHEFFNMYSGETESVAEVMERLRGGHLDL